MRNTLLFAVSGAFGAALLVLACGTSSSSGGSDGGGSGSCGDPPPGRCATGGCNGETTGEVCVDGSWTCPPESEIACFIDAGGGDDGGANEAGSSGDGGIDCVTVTCIAATQYCSIRGGGAQPLDGGSNMTYSCPALPTMPCEAGTGCACIPDKCSCTDDGGAITNACLFP